MDPNTIVPKIEREDPSTLEMSEHILPNVTDWEVGKRYYIRLSAECLGINKGSIFDPNNENEVRAKFAVSGARVLGIDDKEEEEDKDVFKDGMQKKDTVKNMFSRALTKSEKKKKKLK